MLKIGSNDISALYIGNTEIEKAYLGSTVVYEKTPTDIAAILFTAKADNSSVGFYKIGQDRYGNPHQIEYSTDGRNWSSATESTSISMDSGDTVYLRGILGSSGIDDDDWYTNLTVGGDVKLSGNINAIWDYTAQDLGSGFTLPYQCGQYLFASCTGITDVTELLMPADTLSKNCYYGMFYGCSGIEEAPSLPATTLAESCYGGMFSACSSLATCPVLSATTLANGCYGSMFAGCTSLTTAPVLPATTLAEGCYIQMFDNCTSLTTPPALPATTLAYGCYGGMFQGCTSLTSAPSLPATTLSSSCYHNMFSSCTSLVTPPALPATSLTYYCYAFMFKNCTGLTTAPVLSATTLSETCYYYMFQNCISLTTAPDLPATTLANRCYYGMFMGCTGLTTAPDLLATTLVSQCYQAMFMNCSSLNYIKCLATDISANNCLTNWVNGVSSSGTFVKDADAAWSRGVSGIPTNWTIDNINAFVTFQALSDNSSIGLVTKSTNQTLEYSNDATTWSAMTTATTISMDSGESVYVRGILSGDNSTGNTTNFNIQGNVKASGNINTIWGYNEANLGSGFTLYQYCGDKMFSGCTGLVDVTELELPANTLSYWGYHQMFHSCTGLVTAPALPATTMAQGCYLSMFAYCTSLVNAPVLPATTLVNGCYYGMFNHCTSLLVSPTLKAATLVTNCYKEMFLGCTNLRHIECLATSGISTAVTQNWVSGVSANGTIQLSNEGFSTWSSGVSGYPTSGWFRYTDYIQMKSNGNSTIGLAKKGSKMSGFRVVKGDDWEIVTSEMTTATTINLSDGEFIRCWANLSSANTTSDYTQFAITGDIELSGNCNAMNSQKSSTALKDYCFTRMFSGCSITSVSSTFLPATTLSVDCYANMFRDCPNLKNAPNLPATTLKNACYGWMFQDCTSLTYAPTLSATTLVQDCYRGMFYGCTNLVWIKCLATSISASNCTYNWVYNAPASGTFVKKSSMSSWTTGTSGIPSGWTVQNV